MAEIIVSAILVVAILLLVTELVPVDLTALGIIAMLMVLGVLEPCDPQKADPPLIRGIRTAKISRFGPAKPASHLGLISFGKASLAPVLSYPTYRSRT